MKMRNILLTFLLLPFLVACGSGSRSSPSSAGGQAGQISAVVQEEVTVQSPNGQIWGEVFRPDDSKHHPIMIYSHGLGSSYRYGEDYGQALAQQGYVVYTFDFYGGSYSGRSGGQMTDMTVFTEVADLNAVIDQMKQQSYVDGDNVFLMGASQGGVVSSLTASSRDDIRGLLLNYPAFVLRDDMREMFSSVSAVPDTFSLMGMTLGGDYARSVLDVDLMGEATRYTGPVLILHGTSDSTAPISYSEDAVTRFANARLISLDGVGHSFSGNTLNRSIQETETFLADNLG